MTQITTLVLGLACSLSFVLGQTSEKKKDEPHPAVQAVVTWAEAHKNGEVKPEEQIIRPKDMPTFERIGEDYNEFGKVIGGMILAEKDKLSFKVSDKDPRSGLLVLKGTRKLPMVQADERWFIDLPMFLSEIKESAQRSTAELDMMSLMANLKQYRLIGGTYPSEEQGLQVLWKMPTTSPRPRRWVQTIANTEALNDPWSHPYQYKLVEGKPVITSLGPDGKVSQDDISSAED